MQLLVYHNARNRGNVSDFDWTPIQERRKVMVNMGCRIASYKRVKSCRYNVHLSTENRRCLPRRLELSLFGALDLLLEKSDFLLESRCSRGLRRSQGAQRGVHSSCRTWPQALLKYHRAAA